MLKTEKYILPNIQVCDTRESVERYKVYSIIVGKNKGKLC